MVSRDSVVLRFGRLITGTILAVASVPVSDGIAATTPSPPSVILDTTPPTQSGQTISVASGDNLQAALNSAQPGDTVELAAGATFTGNFVLPQKTGPGWIWIRTSAYNSLPARGIRVTPSNASLMAKIVSPNTAPAITFDMSASFYRLSGLEITTTWTSTQATNYGLIMMGYSASGVPATSFSQLPTDVVFDRCYIHGTSTGNVRRGITMNSARTAVLDSYLSDFHEVGADTQALVSWNGSGPFQIINNYLEGAGENVMFGGSDPSISTLVPSDIEIRNNLFSKKLSWKSGDPSYAGIPWSVKNLLELKNARRVLINGNTFERSWAASQVGFAVVLTPRNQNGSAPWSTVEDVTFTNNIIRHAASGINVLGTDDTYSSQRTDRILIRNNLLYDIDGAAWGGGSGILLQVLAGVRNLTFRHNTGIQSGSIIVADGSPSSAFEFADNITPHNAYGVYGSGQGVGNSAIAYYFPQAVFTNNAIAGPWPTSGGATTSMYSNYPGNFFPASLAAVGFVDLGKDNYRLSSSSPFKNQASDGTDVGVDFESLEAALAGASAPPPSATPTANPTPSPTASPIPTPTPSPAPVNDTTAPTTSIVNPLSGATVSGTQSISVTASDDVGVADGAIMIDGAIVASFSGTSATYNWNTSQTNAGGHTLRSKVQDGAGNVGMSAPVSVTVVDADGDLTLPNVTITYPSSGATVASGSQTVTADASDNVGVTVVKTYINGSLVCQDTTAPYACPVYLSGTLATVNVTALDAAGNSRTAEVNVKVSSSGSGTSSGSGSGSDSGSTDTTPPNVAITYPASGATVASGPQTVTVNAFDNVGVAMVKTYLNGSLVCQDTVAPYSCPVSLSGSLATINATALDAAGNSATTEVNVKVTSGSGSNDNSGGGSNSSDTTPPRVTIVNPANGSRVRVGSNIYITANAWDNIGVTTVKAYANGSFICQDSTAPYSCPWSVGSRGKVTIEVKAFDEAGNVGSAAASVFPR